MATTVERSDDLLAEPVESKLAIIKRISWGAVFAGVVVALVVQLALGVLGLAIGTGSIEPLREQHPMSGIGLGAGIWFAVSVLISLFLGGWVAGRLAGVPRNVDSALHGILTWGVTTLLTLYLLTTAVGTLIGGAVTVLGKGLNLIGQGVSAAAPGIASAMNIDINEIKNEVRTTLQQTGKSELQPGNLEQRARGAAETARQGAGEASKNPQEAEAEITGIWTRIVASGKEVLDAADREALVNVLVARTDMDRAQANQAVDRWEQTYQQARVRFAQAKEDAETKARQMGDSAARTISQAATWTFIGFVFGALAAAIGGWVSRPRNIAVPVRHASV